MTRPDVEVWRNVAQGISSIKKLDPMNREMDTIIRGGQTFTITPFERQMNQQYAASPDLDMFRNGRLVIIEAADATNAAEIESINSWTDAEIDDFVLQAKGNLEAAVPFLERVQSIVTLRRIEETAIEEEVSELVPHIESRMKVLNPDLPVETVTVVGGTATTTAPKAVTPDG